MSNLPLAQVRDHVDGDREHAGPEGVRQEGVSQRHLPGRDVAGTAGSAERRNRHVRPDQVAEIGIVRQFLGSADDPT